MARLPLTPRDLEGVLVVQRPINNIIINGAPVNYLGAPVVPNVNTGTFDFVKKLMRVLWFRIFDLDLDNLKYLIPVAIASNEDTYKTWKNELGRQMNDAKWYFLDKCRKYVREAMARPGWSVIQDSHGQRSQVFYNMLAPNVVIDCYQRLRMAVDVDGILGSQPQRDLQWAAYMRAVIVGGMNAEWMCRLSPAAVASIAQDGGKYQSEVDIGQALLDLTNPTTGDPAIVFGPSLYDVPLNPTFVASSGAQILNHNQHGQQLFAHLVQHPY